jgi:hypothetical protein
MIHPSRLPLLWAAAGLFVAACASTPRKAAAPALVGFALRDKQVRMEGLREEISTPGPDHRRFDPLVGTFRAKISLWHEGATEPQVSEGTSTNAWVAGGRFLACELRAHFDGQPIERRSTFGYDRARGEFVEMCVDSTTTQMPEVARGQAGASPDEIVFTRSVDDTLRGRVVHLREVLRIESWNRHRFEVWSDSSGSAPRCLLELSFERVR